MHESVILINKSLKIAYNSINGILRVIESCKRVIGNDNLPEDIIRRLDIINTYIEKICNDILSVRENENEILIITLSKFYNLYLSKDKKEREKLADEIKDLIESLYFDWYYEFIDNIGEYEFNIIKNITAMVFIIWLCKRIGERW